MSIALIGFGANLGSPEQKYRRAISLLHAFPGISVKGASRLFQTSPIGGPANQPRFHNGAILLEVTLPPHELLAAMQQIEASLGRVRTSHWSAREIDLDLHLYNDQQSGGCISSETLTLPHPRFQYRRFALAPAAELAGDMLHPLFSQTVSQLLANLDRVPRIVAIASNDDTAALNFAKQLSHRAGAPFTDRIESTASSSSDELVTIQSTRAPILPPPQLVIWIDAQPIPEELSGRLFQSHFSTWTCIDATASEHALDEAAAAVAAMRHFE